LKIIQIFLVKPRTYPIERPVFTAQMWWVI